IWRKDAKGMKKIAYLTSLSHLRIARSKDGIHFTVDDKPTILPRAEDECW
ncbi:MAG TPA: glycosidase, partial [Lachnospiraceae bacterium]|nr:glycosidase [Lachnospiraceae bacterium]